MMSSAPRTMEKRAADVLQAALSQISAIRIKAIEFESHDPESATNNPADLCAQIDVYGHARTLLCKFKSGKQHTHIREAIERLCLSASTHSGGCTPLLIAPCISRREQDLCRERGISYLDMEGNLRLVMDEMFILRRSQPCRAASVQQEGSARNPPVQRGFPPHHAIPATAPASLHHLAG